MVISSYTKYYIFYLLFLTVLLSSCGGNNPSKGDGRIPVSVEDYKITAYNPDYAQGFNILGTEEGKSTILETLSPWQDAGIITKLFIRRGDEPLPADFEGQVIDGDAKRIICMSTSHIAMIDAVGATNRIVGVSGIDFVSNPEIRARKKAPGDVGYDGNIDYETLLALEPDVVLIYGVSSASGMEQKLKELQIPYAYIGDYTEQNPLGKAEWMVAVGEIMGLRDKAVKAFSAIPPRYEEVKAKVSQLESRPRVMLNAPYGDSWVLPSSDNFMARLIADAGGNYPFEGSPGKSTPIDMEEAFVMAESADIWLNLGSAADLKELSKMVPKFMEVKPILTKKVYNNTLATNQAGGNDFWESGVVHPDKILLDLAAIFHPEQFPNHKFVYYKQLQ